MLELNHLHRGHQWSNTEAQLDLVWFHLVQSAASSVGSASASTKLGGVRSGHFLCVL